MTSSGRIAFALGAVIASIAGPVFSSDDYPTKVTCSNSAMISASFSATLSFDRSGRSSMTRSIYDFSQKYNTLVLNSYPNSMECESQMGPGRTPARVLSGGCSSLI